LSINSCPVTATVNGHLSPLEIIGQTDDDERLLQALEGLTLESGVLDEDSDVGQDGTVGKEDGREATNNANTDK